MENCNHNNGNSWCYKKEKTIQNNSIFVMRKRKCSICGKIQVFVKDPNGKLFDDGEWVNSKN